MAIQLTPIEAHERTVREIFSDEYAFLVPAYQRPYAWEEDQVRELFNDLSDAMDDENASGGMYFLGSIVLIKLPNDPNSRIIDGQQRLTTLTILLSILRDLTTDAERQFDRRDYIFQKANPDRGTSERFRLLLRKQDQPFFLKYVQEPGATNKLPDPENLQGSQYRIAANARYLREHLEGIEEKRRDALVAFIVQRCYLVVVAVPTAESARRIFTVLNARGLDLTPTDILKADLLERAGELQELALAERWEAVETAIGRDEMVELFGHIRMIYEREKPRLALDVAFPKVVVPFIAKPEGFISDIVEPMADAFRLLNERGTIRVHRQFGSEAAKAVCSLGRIDNKDWMPAALLRLWKPHSEEDSKSTADFLIKLERLAYFLFVTRKGVNERIGRFAAVMDEFDPRQNNNSPPIGLALTEQEQGEFIEALEGPLYRKTRVCKPVLQRLDEALSSGGASYDELVSIEHVLPQTVDDGSEWAALFPDESDRVTWTDRLANLVFLTQRINIRASNWDFERKKKEYFSSTDGSSPFVITQGVLQTEQWTPDHLAARQKKLIEKLKTVWELAAPSTTFPEIASKATRESSDSKYAERRRKMLIEALSQREGVALTNKKGILFSSGDGKLRAACSVSKRYVRGTSAYYWYGYSEEWPVFFSEADKSFLVLGCSDQNVGYAIPNDVMAKILTNLYKTPDKHWHIILEENERGEFELAIPNGTRMPLKKFELKVS